VKCLECKIWYCNNKHSNQKESDIFIHLHKSKHTKVGLYNNKDVVAPLECQDCRKANVYKLVMVMKKKDLSIVCLSCLKKNHKKLFESDQWENVIQEKRLSYWLVTPSPPEVLQKSRDLTYRQKNLVEKARRGGYQVNQKQLEEYKVYVKKEPLAQVQSTFQNVQDYSNVFNSLLELEEKEDQRIRGAWFQENIRLDWKNSSAYLSYTDDDEFFEGQLSLSDKLKISSGDWSAEGLVKYITDQQVCLVVPKESVNQRIRKVKVEYVWTNISYDRMKTALKEFYLNNVIPQNLQHHIFNPPKKALETQNLDADAVKQRLKHLFESKRLPEMNEYQLQATTLALRNDPITLIQGPPGIGKTVTLTAILYLLAQNLKASSKILVCAPSNVAVDHIAEKLVSLGIQISRVYSKSREIISVPNQTLEPVSLHRLVRRLDETEEQKRLQKLLRLKDHHVWLKNSEQKEYQDLLRAAEQLVLEKVQIICCTCITAGDFRLSDYVFDYVVIDEAAQALEPETLLPLVKGAGGKVILTGDHKQLGPVIRSKEAQKANFGQSLFERFTSSIDPFILRKQYRMHPKISAFPIGAFYDNVVENAENIQTIITDKFPWPIKDHPKLLSYSRQRTSIFRS